MQSDHSDTVENIKLNGEEVDARQHLITNENFHLLRRCQQDIYEATETSPSLRKIINEVINVENLEKVKSKFIAVWSV